MAREPIAVPDAPVPEEWDPRSGTFILQSPEHRRALAAAGAIAAGAVQILGRRRRSLGEILDRLTRERFA